MGPEESAKAGQLFSPTVHTAFPNKGIVILIGVSPLLESGQLQRDCSYFCCFCFLNLRLNIELRDSKPNTPLEPN